MYDGLELENVIAWLETQVEPGDVARPGWNGAHSDRGDYSELAFRPCAEATAADMLRIARAQVGATHSGYKGGDYVMDKSTCCLFGEWGACGAAISKESLSGMFAGGRIASLEAELAGVREMLRDRISDVEHEYARAKDYEAANVELHDERDRLLDDLSDCEAEVERLTADIARLRAALEKRTEFAENVIEATCWGAYFHDLNDVGTQDLALKCGIIREIPGGFDPEKHHDGSGVCEPGDTFYEFVTVEDILAADGEGET